MENAEIKEIEKKEPFLDSLSAKEWFVLLTAVLLLWKAYSSYIFPITTRIVPADEYANPELKGCKLLVRGEDNELIGVFCK